MPLSLTISASLRAYAAIAAAAAAVAPVVLRHLDVWRQLVQPRISAALPQVEEDDASIPAKHRQNTNSTEKCQLVKPGIAAALSQVEDINACVLGKRT
jgi:hypothetical protein